MKLSKVDIGSNLCIIKVRSNDTKYSFLKTFKENMKISNHIHGQQIYQNTPYCLNLNFKALIYMNKI